MARSSVGGVLLSAATLTIFLCAAAAAGPVPDAHAEAVRVSGVSLGGTAIIKMTDGSADGNGITEFRVWLGGADEGTAIKSFKTERGWVGKKDTDPLRSGVIFTSPREVGPGEPVRFGIKTDGDSPVFRWAAYDGAGTRTDTGSVAPDRLGTAAAGGGGDGNDSDNGGEGAGQAPAADDGAAGTPGITPEAVFRIIPDKPSIGTPIRVTGSGFGASQQFDFLMNSQVLESFGTDEGGRFITTAWLPAGQEAERVTFAVRDSMDNTKVISIRVVNNTGAALQEFVDITVQGMADTLHRGDILNLFGTADPNSTITITTVNSQGEIINSRAIDVDARGNWRIEEPIIIPADMPFGQYTATASDGREEITRTFSVESGKVIIIEPAKLKYDLGETVAFEGTAMPNQPIEMVLEDPLGVEITSTILQIGADGAVRFEFPTAQNTKKGTYTLIATQGQHKELVYVGVGERHKVPVNIEFDKLNYKRSETAVVLMSGEASAAVSLTVINPSGNNEVGEPISVTLGPDGRAVHRLDLSAYAPGGYTAVISMGKTQSVEMFGVDLQTGADIKINTTKEDYYRGDSILILGETEKNALFTITMRDSGGSVIKSKDTFSDNEGKISEKSFRIPADAVAGTWEIRAETGATYDTKQIEVITTKPDEIVLTITQDDTIPGTKTIRIQAIGVQQTVEIDIVSPGGGVFAELKVPASDHNEINIPWNVPEDIEPGTYTIRVTDPFSSVSATHVIK